MAKSDSALPLPNARGRAVSPDAARVRGGSSTAAPSAPTGSSPNPVADVVAHDPALERLRSKKVKRTGLNVHINTQVHSAFAAFVDQFELPKGDATSLAIQEFLERRGVVIPGVARVLPPPAPENNNAAAGQGEGGDLAVNG